MDGWYRTIDIICNQAEKNGVWSVTLNLGGGDKDYKYGLCTGNTLKEAIDTLFNRMAEREFRSLLIVNDILLLCTFTVMSLRKDIALSQLKMCSIIKVVT